jgi:holo-[acyl-carrier protein] synthase
MGAIAVGIDLVEVNRIRRLVERYSEGLSDRIFTPQEWATCEGQAQRLAARFAAKEATAKALGTGLSEAGAHRGVSALDIQTLSEPSGRPTIELSGGARARAAELGLSAFEVSLSHTGQYAIAVVVAQRENP